ncbi:phosphoribosylglycinamide formyltransferase [Phocaeicola sp.]|uniref:phosphoribosylglycinamide formyltransferase n=1 Tax=Phocaeicola sp. TaxID=2773926 RepID=UPI0023BF5D90|nr:phosphoribosylglycinamide formyltransferase [Phocaeicola sp.]MDE5678477.1 phosphoribosylglycinamide formyltransferase [Phocaeicola sp.]
MKKIAILASGEGTNAERIIRYFAEKRTAEIALVIANKTQAGVLKRAERLGVPSVVITPQGFTSGLALEALRRHHIGFIVLAGFLLKVPDDILHDYPNKIVNIHPSLLPRFGGKGMYGTRVHEAVLAAGEKESGITIHYINERYDEGGILFQAACPVLPHDTPQTLAAKVHQLEYEHFPRVIEKVLSDGGPAPHISATSAG